MANDQVAEELTNKPRPSRELLKRYRFESYVSTQADKVPMGFATARTQADHRPKSQRTRVATEAAADVTSHAFAAEQMTCGRSLGHVDWTGCGGGGILAPLIRREMAPTGFHALERQAHLTA